MPQSRPPFILKPVAAAVALAATCLPMFASAADDNDGTKIEAVVVTANKRAQNLQDVPAAITVLNEAALQKANVRGMDDLPALAPALTISYGNQPGNNTLNMRGIGTYSLGVGVETDVAVIVDDVPVAIQANAFKDLADVSRVEVLKGPQSTLFGKSSIAGALNITTKTAGGPLKTTASAQSTNDGEWRVGAALSGAVTDTFRMRLAASKTDYDGNVNNLSTGGKINGTAGKNFNAKFEWNPLDSLTLSLSPHYSETEALCCQSVLTYLTPGALYIGNANLPASSLLQGVTIVPGNRSVRNDYKTGGVFRDAGTALKAQYEFGADSPLAGHTLASITSYSTYHMDDYNDGDQTDGNVLQYLKGVNGSLTGLTGGLYQQGFFNTRALTQELRLTSPSTGRLKYVAGIWYGDNWLERQLHRMPESSFVAYYKTQAWNTSKALFGQASYDFTPSVSLIAGLRLNQENTGYKFYKYAAPGEGQVLTQFYNGDDSNVDKTGKLGVEYRVNPDIMTYAIYSTGHKGVAYDLTSSFNATTAKNSPVPAETAHNFELGAKMTLLNNRAMLNVALFNTNYKGFQQSAGFIDATTGIYTTMLHSIGRLRTRGMELDGAIRVTRELQFNGSFAYTEATIQEFENGPCYNVINAAGVSAVGGNCAVNARYGTTPVQNLAGKTLPNAPKIKLNIGTQIDIPLAAQSFNAFVNGAYRWQSETQFNLNQDPNTIQPGYGILNLSLGLNDKRDRYRVTFFVNNVLDKAYAIGLGDGITTATANSTTGWGLAGAKSVQAISWIPARDASRYLGLRVDTTF